MWGVGRAGRRGDWWGGVAAHAACKGRLDWSLGAGQAGKVHPEHVIHVRDAGRVEVHWLVEPFRFLPSRKRGGVWAMRRGGRWGGGRACSVQGKARLEFEQGAGGVHT